MCDAPSARLGKEIKNKTIFSSETYSRSRAAATRKQRLNNHRRSLRHVTAVKWASCTRPAVHCYARKISNNSLSLSVRHTVITVCTVVQNCCKGYQPLGLKMRISGCPDPDFRSRCRFAPAITFGPARPMQIFNFEGLPCYPPAYPTLS